MRQLSVLIGALALAGCANLNAVVNSPSNPITKERLYAAEANYKVANNAAEIYLSIRQCKRSEAAQPFANRCRTYNSSLKLQAASRKVDAQFRAARACQRNTPSAIDCLAAVENAIAQFRSEIAAVTGVSP